MLSTNQRVLVPWMRSFPLYRCIYIYVCVYTYVCIYRCEVEEDDVYASKSFSAVPEVIPPI